MEDSWPPETFWCAIEGGRALYAGKSRKVLGEARTRFSRYYDVPVWLVCVVVADTREEAEAYFAQWWSQCGV